MKIYRSKIDHWLWIVILFVIIVFVIWAYIDTDITEWGKLSVIFIPSILPVILLMGNIWLNTKYVVDDEKRTLRVKCGVLYDSKYKIDDMTAIYPTSNWLSAPALSFDRLEIRTGKRKSIVISPKNRTDFINHLQRLNPSIEV